MYGLFLRSGMELKRCCLYNLTALGRHGRGVDILTLEAPPTCWFLPSDAEFVRTELFRTSDPSAVRHCMRLCDEATRNEYISSRLLITS